MGIVLVSIVWACGSESSEDAGAIADADRVDAHRRDSSLTDADQSELDASRDADRGAVDAPPGAARLGAATLIQRTYASGPTSGVLSAPAIGTETGSVLLAGIARGHWDHAPDGPSDSLDNVFTALDGTHTYAAWPTSATSLYAAMGARGAADLVVRAEWGEGGGGGDEVTLVVVEVRGASAIEDTSFVERAPGEELTTAPVTTAGPAVLIAIWWGTGGVRPPGTSHVADPGEGFGRIDEASGLVSLSENGYIQVAVAARAVAAGTHTTTWTSDGEGAQLYLVAVQ